MIGSVHEYPLLIREHHIDSFGHVNNAVYLQLFEEARWDLITQNGFGRQTILERQQGPVVLEANVRFKREVRNRQAIRILSWLEGYERKVGTMIQHVVDDTGTPCCEARFLFGLMDFTTRRLVDPTADWWRAIGVEPSQLTAETPAP